MLLGTNTKRCIMLSNNFLARVYFQCPEYKAQFFLAVTEIEIFSWGGGRGVRYLMNQEKFCLYTESVISYIISGRPGEALRPLATNGMIFFQVNKNLKLRF